MNKRYIRQYAKDSCVGLLDAHCDARDGDDLWVGTEDWPEADKDEFAAEVQRIMTRIRR